MHNSHNFLSKQLRPAPPSNRLRLRIKPIGFLSRLLSAWLAALMIFGQPVMVARLIAEEAPQFMPPPVASVATGQPDYAPGTTASIVGRGFQPGENVQVQVLHADGTPARGEDHQPWTVVADPVGNFATTWHVCEDDCLNADLEVRASGETSGRSARVIFHDGPGLPVANPDTYHTYADSGANEIFVVANDYDPDFDALTVIGVAGASHGSVVIASGGGAVYYTPASGYTGSDTFTYTVQDTSANTATATATVNVVTPGHPFAWGRNAESQLAIPANLYVLSPTNMGTGFWKVAGGNSHSVAIKVDGSLWAWGANWAGQLGLGDSQSRTSPTRVGTSADWVSVFTGESHTLALKSDGTLWSWGANWAGQLGHGDAAYRNAPTRVGSSTDWVAVAAGFYHSMAIKSDGTLWTWGYNWAGQLGHGDTTDRYSPIQVGTATDWSDIVAGGYQSLARKNDGTLWTWGYNWAGQLGQGDTTDRYSPTQVGTATDWSDLAVGNGHALARKNDGTLWSWGANWAGQLGHGDTAYRYFPTQVGTATDWNGIAAGVNHTLALKGDGTIWSAGSGFEGQLADVKFSSSQLALKKAQVPPGVSRISSGWYHSFALMGGNTGPVANDDAFSLAEDAALNIPAPGLLNNDIDANGDMLEVRSFTAASHGTVSVLADGSFSYTPVANYNGTDSFTYTIGDGNGGSASATVTVTVTPVNDRPSATPQIIYLDEDTAVNVTLTGSDIDGDMLSFMILSAPAHGTFSGTPPNLVYTPDSNFNGQDFPSFYVSDGMLTSSPALLEFVIRPLNDAPVASAQSLTTPEDTALSIVLGGSDVDADALNFSLTSPPSHGTLSGTPPNLTYTPASNYNGPDSFTFKVNDGTVDSADATVTVSVTPVNDGPQLANPGTKLVNELELLAFTLSAAEVDAGDALTFTISSGAQSGMTLDPSTGAFAWTPTEAQGPGTYSVTFRVTDAAASFDEKTISITVSEVNVVPAISDVPLDVTIPELVPFTFDANGSDPDAPVQMLTFALINAPAGATINAASGVFNWTPTEADGPGDFTFSVRISDGVSTADAPVTLRVTEVNTGPRFPKFANFLIDEGTAIAEDLSATDVDVPANALTYSVVSGAPSGMTLDATTGAFAWTPAEAQGPGSYAVTLRVTDAGGLFDERTLTITVNEVNTAPSATTQNASTAEDTFLAIVLTASDVDLPANALTYSVTSDPSHGSLSGTAPNLTYTPNADYNGTDSFTFEVNDGAGGTASATVSITVTPVNDTPLVNGQSVSTVEDSSLPVTVTGSDIDGDALTYTVVTPPAHGTLSGVAPNLTYTPAPNYFGADSFTFKVNDGTMDSGLATVLIMVTPVNDNPVANNDSAMVNEDSGANVLNVLANDSIAPDVGEALAITGVTSAEHGTVTFTGAAVSYTPDANYFGADSFTYTTSDGNGGTATATVSVTVNNVNDAPALALALPSSSAINENGSVSVAGRVSDADPQDAHTVIINWGDGSTATTLTLAAGVAEFSASHQYLDDRPTGTPSDVYAIIVTASDAAGAVATDTTSVTVNNVAPAITSVTGPTGPLPMNSTATVTVNFSDVGTLDTHTVRIAWDDGTADTVLAGGGFSRSAAHVFTVAGVYTIAVTVTDDDTGEARTTYEYVVVYDPNGSFVTGGGWIQSAMGAYAADLSLSGKANFGFVSKYQRGSTIPTGQTEFQLHFANFNFQSTSYQWLVVSGAKTQYKGSGTINGSSDYGFLLTATDGQVTGGGGVDKFRIKIWNKTDGSVLYDNVPGASDDIDAANPQGLAGGQIVIHAAKR